MSEPIKLVVGLGNPGAEYRGTRHNAGADFVTALAHQHDISLSAEKRFHGFTGRVQTAGMDFRLLLPTTWMNHSDRSVAALAGFFKISGNAILIAHDELDFDAGIVRFKAGGGHGGHNGLRAISAVLGSDYLRLRIGIGHPGSARAGSDYVLSRPARADREKIAAGIGAALAALPALASGDWAKATQQLHSEPTASAGAADG